MRVSSQISLSSELQPGSLPPDADDSSSDMLVIVDEPLSRATNSPVSVSGSVSGSVSDNVNGEWTGDGDARCHFIISLTFEPLEESASGTDGLFVTNTG